MIDLLLDSYIRRKRWEMREQAVAALNAQAEAMGSGRGKSTGAPQQDAPKRKGPIMDMNSFLASQGLH